MADESNDPLSSQYNLQLEKILKNKEAFEKYINEIKSSEKMQYYFSKFNPASVEQFINHYATLKIQWYEFKDVWKNHYEQESVKWIGGAFQGLEDIQQKKLFNAQCLWRAEKTKLEGIEICFDFEYWERKILWCNVVSPIVESEIDFYIRFLRESSLDFDFKELHCSQDYYWIMKDFTEKKDLYYYNKWYEFYDKEFGTDSYLKLPDIRGKKEEVYYKLNSENDKKINPEKYAYHNDTTRLPDLNYYEKGFINDLIKENETPKFYEQNMERKKSIEVWDKNDETNNDMETLLENKTLYYPIVGAKDWRIAVNRTAEKYKRERTIELLPEAFELYKKHLGENFYFPSLDYATAEKIDSEYNLKELYRVRLRSGRKLNGEQEDFNF